MSQRKEFIDLYQRGRSRVIDLCTAFGISEKTAYKWIGRFHEEGPAGLADRSRAPKASPHRVAPELIERIVALRRRYPTYGPRKLREILQTAEPLISWPSPSTIGDVLRCRGLVRRRRQRSARGTPWDASRDGLTVAMSPNDVWAADFKGQFRLGNGRLCYPLTISDLHSRYLLGCCGLASTASDPARVVFTRVFREFGLPRVLRTDNGIPFAQPNALGRLSRLSVWWIKLGIRPERITPGAPQQNGQHERLHRTLKQDALGLPARDYVLQQRRFDRFRQDYNTVRPHESLAMQPPANLYTPSHRAFPARLPRIEYPPLREQRLVGHGAIRFRTKIYMLAGALDGEYVSLEETADAEWTVEFGPLTLGIIDERQGVFTPGVVWKKPSAET